MLLHISENNDVNNMVEKAMSSDAVDSDLGLVRDLQYDCRLIDFLLYLTSNKTYTPKEDVTILWSMGIKS